MIDISLLNAISFLTRLEWNICHIKNEPIRSDSPHSEVGNRLHLLFHEDGDKNSAVHAGKRDFHLECLVLPNRLLLSSLHSSIVNWKPLMIQQYDPSLTRVEAPFLDLNVYFFPPFLFFTLGFRSIRRHVLMHSILRSALIILNWR